MRRLIILFMGLGACGKLESQEGEGCRLGTDCLWPAVCCTAPRIPAFGAPVPLCEDVMYCDAFLPFLVEDNPCQRSLGGVTTFDQCSEGLVCCPKTLTCLDAATCDEAPEPPPAATSASGKTCHADPDCPAGELCLGINMRQRQGTCAPFGGAPAISE